MPVVFRTEGHAFFFYSNEGNPREPVHVHVRKGARSPGSGCTRRYVWRKVTG